MTSDTELTVDEIFVKLDNWYSSTKSHGYPKSSPAEAKQAILSWHNKEQVKLLEDLLDTPLDRQVVNTIGMAAPSMNVIRERITKLKGE